MNQRVSIIILNWNGWKDEMVRGDERGVMGDEYKNEEVYVTYHGLRRY